MVEFKLLGTGAGVGVPLFFCHCPACEEARQNPVFSRTRSGAMFRAAEETILIDASPDLFTQLNREGIETVDVVFLSHWHYDHFGGLGDLEFYVRLKRHKAVQLFLPPSALSEFVAAFPFLTDVFEIIPWRFGQTYSFGETALTPLPAAHSIETAGFLLENKKRLAYFTDTAGLPPATAEKIDQVDFLICDATFNGENWYPHSHMNIEEAIALGRKIRAKKTILTHMSMHYSVPRTVAWLTKKLETEPDIGIGLDGLAIEI